MFVPEVRLYNPREFMRIYKHATVKLYHMRFGPRLVLQCFAENCVFTLDTPKFLSEGKYQYLDEVIEHKDLIERKEGELWRDYDRRVKETIHKVLERIIEEKIKPLGAYEGEFTSLVLIAEQTESDP